MTTQPDPIEAVSPNPYFDGPIWNWFGLTYSAYLVLPRVSLCSMPIGWQRRFVVLMQQAEDMLPPEFHGGTYAVQIRGEHGRFITDPLADYRHPPKVELRPRVRPYELREVYRTVLGKEP